jgi:hypothetical protein
MLLLEQEVFGEDGILMFLIMVHIPYMHGG